MSVSGIDSPATLMIRRHSVSGFSSHAEEKQQDQTILLEVVVKASGLLVCFSDFQLKVWTPISVSGLFICCVTGSRSAQ